MELRTGERYHGVGLYISVMFAVITRLSCIVFLFLVLLSHKDTEALRSLRAIRSSLTFFTSPSLAKVVGASHENPPPSSEHPSQTK